jgi:uncharacterized protein (TIGR04141 family)
MSKTRPFSIYLLKPGYDATNALKEGHSLNEVQAGTLPEAASLFILDGSPSDPWWKSYFGVQMILKQASKSALLFLPIDERCFALSFGHAHHNLKDESFEYDFGLRVTLNCIDPNELKSTDTLDPGAALRRRTQLPVGSDLTYFDFDRDSAILKSLTGKVLSEHAELFRNVTGSSSLSIRSTVASNGLAELCRKLWGFYQSEAYRAIFPDIENIVPVKDPVIIGRLHEKLIEGVRAKSDSLYLTIPDIIDYRNQGFQASFTGLGSSLNHEDVFITKYYEYLESHNRALEDLEYEELCSHGLMLTDEEGKARETYSLINCLIFDTALDNQAQTFHLTEGKWYRVENSYIDKLTAALDPLWVDIPFPHFAHENEGRYNEMIAAENEAFVCLDTENISPAGQTQIEPCDLFSIDEDAAVFHHIKRSTVSAQLSHLFNQGNNAIEVLKLEETCFARLRELISARVSEEAQASFLGPLDGQKYRVVFGIVTHKDRTNKSENLPLFSRVSLMRIARSLRLKNTECRFGFIEDRSERKAGVPKKRKARAVAVAGDQVAV